MHERSGNKPVVAVIGCFALIAMMISTLSADTDMIPGKEILDIHCHVAGIGAGGSGCFVSPAMQKSWRYRIYLQAFGVSEQEVLLEGDDLIIRRLAETLTRSRRVKAAVVLALDAVIKANGEMDRDKTEIYISNEFVVKETRKHSNLLFGASINPYRVDAIKRLEKAKADGAVLVKWLPSIQRIDPADKRLIPFYLKIKELGLPLLVHTGSEHSFTYALDELADPERLRLPLKLGVTVIAAHCGGGGRNQGERNVSRFMRLAAQFPNLYGDISALTQLNHLGHLSRLLRYSELHDRLIYGSDMPLLSTAIVSAWGFIFQLPFTKILKINRIANPWDRDVALKEALGVSTGMLKKSAQFIGLWRDDKTIQKGQLAD